MESGTKIITVYKRFETKGLVATTTYVVPGMATSVGVTRYYDNGKIKGDLEREGIVQSTRSGTWLTSGNTLKAKMKVSVRLFQTFSENVTSTLVTNNRINTFTANSNGARYSGTMTRRK